LVLYPKEHLFQTSESRRVKPYLFTSCLDEAFSETQRR
jgi:hypothetical protein